ncbi:MAG: efflux transporter outer membrane subunit, partial [Alphaproteobacteria bacterium]|nr:efflux transporter outer membrane subunit [Alphaproteobacteria bacterium]
MVVGGCVRLGPDFEKPEADVSATFTETADAKVKAEPADYSQWWTTFNDPVLNSLVASARAQNLDLQAAGVRILEARAVLGIATGNQYPQTQQATGSITGNKLGGESPFTSPRNSFTDFQAGFDAAWELDFWGRFARGIESADAGLRASIADYDDLLVSLTAEVASTYTQIREFEERIRLARRNVEIQTRTLQIADVRFRAGAVTELDVTQARANLRSTQALVPEFEIGLRQSQNALSILLGQPPSELRDVLGGDKPIPTAPPEVAVGIPAELLRRRPDIRRAELDAATQSAQIGVARADLFPRFQLVGNIGFEADQAKDWFTGRAFNAFGGPTVSWNILNYGRITNNVRAQDARYQQLIVDYQNTVLQAAQEVEDGLAGFIRSQQQARFLAGAVQALTRSVDLSLQQYRTGVVDFQRVLDVQRDLVGRQDDLAAT